MEAQQEQRVQKVVTEQNTKALRAVLLCWRMVAEDRRLYKSFRERFAEFAEYQHDIDLSTALGFSSHVGVTTWSQRNFGTLYMVTSPAYQALL